MCTYTKTKQQQQNNTNNKKPTLTLVTQQMISVLLQLHFFWGVGGLKCGSNTPVDYKKLAKAEAIVGDWVV